MRNPLLRSEYYRILIALLLATGLILLHLLFKGTSLPVMPPQPIATGGSTTAPPQNVLNVPGPNASAEEKRAHFDLAVRLAQESSTLDLTNCTASPVVLKTTRGAVITLTNRGMSDVTLALDRDHITKVPAQQSIPFTINFDKGPGVYGYGCNMGSGTAGLILLTP